MPVTGPNLNAAREEGRKVGRQLLADLIEQHHLFDITEDVYGEGAKMGWHLLIPNARQDWEKAKEDFVAAVGSLFEQDASNSF